MDRIVESHDQTFPVDLVERTRWSGPMRCGESTRGSTGVFTYVRYLQGICKQDFIDDPDAIKVIFRDSAFQIFSQINVLALIYDEGCGQCNILTFNYGKASGSTRKIAKLASGSRRKHPIFRFLDEKERYICEVRYGGTAANALQWGLWTHAGNALPHFESVAGGWADYSSSEILAELISCALISSSEGHKSAVDKLREDIRCLKSGVEG